jgi:hypothetical protein
MPQMLQIESKPVRLAEVLEEAGQAGIDRVAAAVDDPGPGEQRGDDPQVQKVERQLIDHARRLSAPFPKRL